MSTKLTPLAATLIARKDKPASPAPAAASPGETAHSGEPKVYQTGEPLNFRVKKEFKRLFKSTAAQHDMKMNALLVEAFEVWLREKRER